MDLELTDSDHAELASMVRSQGWPVFQRIAVSIATEYNDRLDNLEPDADGYLQKLKGLHLLSKSAKQYWASVVQELNKQLEQGAAPKVDPTVALPDKTEDLLED